MFDTKNISINTRLFEQEKAAILSGFLSRQDAINSGAKYIKKWRRKEVSSSKNNNGYTIKGNIIALDYVQVVEEAYYEIVGGDEDNNGRGHIISIFNATAAYGTGATIDFGGVIDDYGNSNLYFTFGITGGIGASAGMGYIRTNKGFKNNDLAGEAVNSNFSILGPLSADFSGDRSGSFPCATTYTYGGNIGVGGGYFQNWTYTILAPVPNGEQVWQMIRHWH